MSYNYREEMAQDIKEYIRENESEFEGIVVPILRAHCYTLKEKLDYIKGMKMYRTSTLDQELDNKDYRKTDLVFDIPV